MPEKIRLITSQNSWSLEKSNRKRALADLECFREKNNQTIHLVIN